MPELPEVEVTRRLLEPGMLGRTIESVETSADSYFFVTPPERLRLRLPGLAVRDLTRQGKYLIAGLADGSRLVLHLGMSGQLFLTGTVGIPLMKRTVPGAIVPSQQPSFIGDSHTHLCLSFADGEPRVLFRDVRKFGKVQLLDPGISSSRLERLGVDALIASGEDLFRASRRRRVSVKALLLDQSALAGVGNIYADEALFLSRVTPTLRALRLTRDKCQRIVEAVQAVMQRSIASGGASISDFYAPDGQQGSYQRERRVYAREGQPCWDCGTTIKKRMVAQRGTHYCPKCQR